MKETQQTLEKMTGLAQRREVIIFISCSLLILLVIAVLYTQQRQTDNNLQETQALSSMHQSSEILKRDILRSYTDIQFIASLKQARNANPESSESLEELEETFTNFARTQKRYYQVRMLDREGMEIVRIDWDVEKTKQVKGDSLQDKSEREYFKQSLDLPPGSTYVSDLNLNREHGKIESPFKPVIRFETPVTSPSGEAGNLVILNYDCQEIFQEISSSAPSGKTYLVRSDGHFILGPDPDSEWGWELGHEIQLGSLFPDVEEELNQADQNEGIIWSEEGLFSYGAVHVLPDEKENIKSPLSSYWLLHHIPRDESVAGLQKWGTGLLTGFAALIPLLALTIIWNTAARLRHRNAMLARTELEKAEAKLRGIFNSSNNIVGLMKPDGTLIDINQTAIDSTGVTFEEITGKPLWETVWWKHSPELQERLKKAIQKAASGERDSFEATFPGYKGQFVEVEFTVSPVLTKDGRVIYLVPEGYDITVRKHQERELQHSYDQLEETNRELEQFAYVASHDLRSPLRGISQAASFIIEDEADNLSESSKGYFEKLKARIVRMQILLDDLLVYSRISRADTQLEEVDIAQLIKEVLDLLIIPEGFVINVPDKLPTFVTSVTPLRQIFLNLVGNALKHHDKNEGLITIGFTELENMYEFQVSDDGPGIEERYHEQIFEMFRTLKPRDDVEGSGMGLAIIRKLVRRYGGEITVESTPGQGSTFRFTWPKTIPAEK